MSRTKKAIMRYSSLLRSMFQELDKIIPEDDVSVVSPEEARDAIVILRNIVQAQSHLIDALVNDVIALQNGKK